MSFKFLLSIQKRFGLNILKSWISLNTPNCGGMKTVIQAWKTIDVLKG